jgi:hypothetical protein
VNATAPASLITGVDQDDETEQLIPVLGDPHRFVVHEGGVVGFHRGGCSTDGCDAVLVRVVREANDSVDVSLFRSPCRDPRVSQFLALSLAPWAVGTRR